MGTGELSGKRNEKLKGGGINLAMDWHPIQGRVVILFFCFMLWKVG